MSLAKRLSAVQPNQPNDGCRTCKWLQTLSDADLKAWDDWLASGHSRAQLYDIATSDPDNPLQVSKTGFRHHLRHGTE